MTERPLCPACRVPLRTERNPKQPLLALKPTYPTLGCTNCGARFADVGRTPQRYVRLLPPARSETKG